MKQIRLRDKTIKISGCNKCPFWSWMEAVCMEGGTGNHMRASTPIDIPAECPLEEYIVNKDDGKSKFYRCSYPYYDYGICGYRSPSGECTKPDINCTYMWLKK